MPFQRRRRAFVALDAGFKCRILARLLRGSFFMLAGFLLSLHFIDSFNIQAMRGRREFSASPHIGPRASSRARVASKFDMRDCDDDWRLHMLRYVAFRRRTIIG